MRRRISLDTESVGTSSALPLLACGVNSSSSSFPMARINKFASANLNDSYGMPDRGGSASNGNNASSSSSGKSRISSSGGMLILSRPGRNTQAQSHPSPSAAKPGQARLAIPSPVNLPSIKRESSAGDAVTGHTSTIPGWSKGESPPLNSGWSRGESPSDSLSFPSLYKSGISRSLDTTGETLKIVMSGSRPDVYAPPAMRAGANLAGSTSRLLRPPTPPFEKPRSMIIRGEEFPTLQAVAAARPPTPPQLSKQKDVQYKHFDKQNGTALQKMNLEEQSKVSEARQLQSGHHQPGNGNFQSNSMVLSLRPLGRPESTSSESARQKGDLVGSGSESSLQAEKNMNSGVNLGASATEFPVRSARSINPGGNAMHGFPHEESSSSASPAAGPASAQVCNSKGSGAHLDRPLSRPPSVGLETRINIIDSTHNLRPQYKTSLSSSQNNASGEERHLNVQSSSGSLWSASTGREFVTSTHKSIEHSKAFAGDPKKVVGADKMRVLPERDSPPAKEGSFKRESFASGEANPYGLIKESAYTKQMELPNDNVCKDLTWSSSLVHDVPRIEGFHSQRSFGREMHSRSFQEGAAKAIKDSNTRDDAVTVTYDRDVRDNFGRETGNVYSKDVREACTQDAQNVYSRDVREVCNQDSTQIKQLDSVHSINNDGVGSLRGQYNRADLLGGRFNANPAVLSSSNRGFVYDAHDSKFNRPQGMKDQSPVTEIHTITNTRANRMNVSSGKHDQSLIGEENIAIDHKYLQDQFADKTNIKSNNLEISNARNSRMAVPISNSMRMVNDVHDAHSGRQHTFQEDSRVIRYEDKVVDVKRVNNGTFVPSHTTQRSFSRKEATQGSVQTLQIDANKKQADEKFFRDNVNKHFDLEDERRKEAAKMKLMELEDRIARREMEGRKDEVEWKGKGPMESLVTQQHDLGQLPSNTQYFSKQMGGDSSPDLVGEDGEPGSRIVHPYVASSVSSRTHRTRESLTSHQLQGSRLVGDSEDRKVVPPRSPSSWRSELGGGPTSKLFSSPYVESGGFHHTAGGTYKLF